MRRATNPHGGSARSVVDSSINVPHNFSLCSLASHPALLRTPDHHTSRPLLRRSGARLLETDPLGPATVDEASEGVPPRYRAAGLRPPWGKHSGARGLDGLSAWRAPLFRSRQTETQRAPLCPTPVGRERPVYPATALARHHTQHAAPTARHAPTPPTRTVRAPSHLWPLPPCVARRRLRPSHVSGPGAAKWRGGHSSRLARVLPLALRCDPASQLCLSQTPSISSSLLVGQELEGEGMARRSCPAWRVQSVTKSHPSCA